LVAKYVRPNRKNDSVGKGQAVRCEDKQIRITIMIPTYNQSAYIKEAIDSALAQTYPWIEVIVGDDASTDQTSQVVSKIRDSRLVYIKNPTNLTRTENYKNLLYNHATGDFVVNLDGDDYFTDLDFVSKAVSLLKHYNNAVMVVAKVTTKTLIDEYISALPDIKYATGLQILGELPNPKYMFMHMGVIYNRQSALEIDFYRSTAISSDWESLYRLALRGDVLYLDRNIGTWRVHGKNETGTTNIKKLIDNLAIWEAIFNDAINFGLSPLRAKIASAKCIGSFVLPSCASISKNGNRSLLKFVFLSFTRYKLALLFALFSPRYVATVILCFLGYYRRNS
jgi:glycosyltransferase involved in cell wall biosynthesis